MNIQPNLTIRQQRAMAQLRQCAIGEVPSLTARMLESPPWFYRWVPWIFPLAGVLGMAMLALPFIQIPENWGDSLTFRGKGSIELNADQSLTIGLKPIGGLVMLQGPADLRVEKASRRLLTGRREGAFYLSYGELYFQSDPKVSKEILIQTPLLMARVHGTQFLIGHHPNGGSRLMVKEGQVEVKPAGSLKGWETVASGMLFSVSPDRTLRQEAFDQTQPLSGSFLKEMTLPNSVEPGTIPRYVDDREPSVDLKQLLWHEEG